MIVTERNLSLCPSRFIVLSLITRTEDRPPVDLDYWVSAWERLTSWCRLLVYFSFILTTDKYEMVRRSSLRPDLPPLDTETNITGSVHVTSPILFRSPTSDNDDYHKPLRDFKLISRRRSHQDPGFGSGSGSGFGDDYRYLVGSGSSAGMMPGSPMFAAERTLSGLIDYPVMMAAGPVPSEQDKDKTVSGPTTSASLFLPSTTATVKNGTCIGRNHKSSEGLISPVRRRANASI
jgi:hypothetical protein